VGLGGVSEDARTTAGAMERKGTRGELGLLGFGISTDQLEQVLATTNSDQICDWASAIGCTACGCQRVLTRRPATHVQLGN